MKKTVRARRLQFEPLEERALLAVSVAEFNQIRAMYPDLNLAENMEKYNVIEITAAKLSTKSLQSAVDTAAQTAQDDLIVIRTDGNNKTLLLDGNPITIDIDSAQFGSVAIVSLSTSKTPLIVDTQEMSRAFRINSGSVAMGGMKIVGQTWDFDIGNDYDGLIAVRGQSVLTTSNVQTVATVQTVSATLDPMNMPPSLANDALTWNWPESDDWDTGDAVMVAAPFGADAASDSLAAVPYGARASDTSEYMIGNVIVSLVLMESNGAIDPSVASWTTTKINQVKTQVRRGLDWWENMFDINNPNSQIKLNFIIDFTWADKPFETSYEPIVNTEVELWAGEFTASLGYTNAFSSSINTFNNAQRNAYNTDWTFTTFVTNSRPWSEQNPDAPDPRYGYAYFGGPYTVVSYDTAGWGIDNLGMILAHEVGHIFYAMDEYPGAGSYNGYSGYYNIQNTNAIDDHPNPASRNISTIMGDGSEMIRAFGARTSSEPSLQAIGWRDSDGNGILDVLDTPLTLSPTTGTGTFDMLTKIFTFSGTSSVTTLPNQNPYGSGNNITLNTVDKLQYQLNNGNWITLDATYGGTTNVRVNAAVSLANVAEGQHSIAFRTICTRTGVTSVERSYNFIIPIKLAVPTLGEVVETGSSTISVAWTAVTNANGYVIQYATNSAFTTGVGTVTVRSQSTTSTTIAGLNPYTTYYVRILATGTGLYRDSDFSGWKSAMTEKAKLSTPTLSNLSAFENTIFVEWKPVAESNGYVVEYATDAGFTTDVVTVPVSFASAIAINFSGLNPNTTYYVHIKATGTEAYIDSDYSLVRSTWTDRFKLPTPTLGDVVEIGSKEISVSWNTVTNAGGYVVEYATNSAFTAGVGTVTIDSPSVTSAVIPELNPNTTYYVNVRAIRSNNDYIDSDFSRWKSATTLELDTIAMPSDGAPHDWSIRKSQVENNLLEIVDLHNSSVMSSFSLDVIDRLVVKSSGVANDSLTIDFTYGDFHLTNGVRFNGHAETLDTLYFIGTPGDDTIILDGTDNRFNDLPVYTQNVENFILDAGEGRDQALVVGTESNNTFNASDNLFVMVGGGYRLELGNFNVIDAVAAGRYDKTFVYGANNSLIVMSDQLTERRATDQVYRIWHSGQVTAVNMDESNNVILHTGSRGYDAYALTPGYGTATNALGSYFHEFVGFENVVTPFMPSDASPANASLTMAPQAAVSEMTPDEETLTHALWDESLFTFLVDEQIRSQRKKDAYHETDDWLADFEKLALLDLRK